MGRRLPCRAPVLHLPATPRGPAMRSGCSAVPQDVSPRPHLTSRGGRARRSPPGCDGCPGSCCAPLTVPSRSGSCQPCPLLWGAKPPCAPPPHHPPRARGGSGALHGEGMGADGAGPPTAELGWRWGAEALPANGRVRQIPWSHTSSSPKSWGRGLSPPPRAGSPKPQDPRGHGRIPGCCPHPRAEPNTCHLPTTWPDTRYGGSPRHGAASPAS